MSHVTTGYLLRNALLGNRCKNIEECPFAKPDATAYSTTRLPTACTAYYHTKQHEIKSRIREEDAINRQGKYEMYETAPQITRHTVHSKQ